MHGDKEIANLHIGAPTDDDPAQFTRVISDKGTMDWGEAKKVRGEYCRAYSDQQGKNCHAPFQMGIPIYMANEPLSVSIEALPDEREKIYLEYFNGHSYQRLGTVNQGRTVFEFSLKTADSEIEASIDPGERPLPEEGPAETPVAGVDFDSLQKNNSVYGSGESRIGIEKLDILDEDGKSVRTFLTGGTMRFHIRLLLREATESFFLVVCIMNLNGKPVTQVFCKSEDLDVSNQIGGITIEACLSPVRLGAGDYMASVGIYKTCSMSRYEEEEAYIVVDRALFFKVEQPFMIRKSLGSVLHVCEWRWGEKTYVFDGTNLKNGEGQ